MLPPVDDTGDFFGLLAVFAQDSEFVFAVFAVPDGELTAQEHGYTDLTGVGGDGILCHDFAV